MNNLISWIFGVLLGESILSTWLFLSCDLAILNLVALFMIYFESCFCSNKIFTKWIKILINTWFPEIHKKKGKQTLFYRNSKWLFPQVGFFLWYFPSFSLFVSSASLCVSFDVCSLHLFFFFFCQEFVQSLYCERSLKIFCSYIRDSQVATIQEIRYEALTKV